MVLGSHNSWSYFPCRKWWLKPFAFMAKCQRVNILQQYALGVRCFDLRVRFNKNKLIVAHGLMEYAVEEGTLLDQLKMLDDFGNCYVRVVHEARNSKQYSYESIANFKNFCQYLQETYKNTIFWCGRNLVDWTVDYKFPTEPSCEEKYSSVCSPKTIDDWWPWLYAKLHNKKIKKYGTEKRILLIDYVDV